MRTSSGLLVVCLLACSDDAGSSRVVDTIDAASDSDDVAAPDPSDSDDVDASDPGDAIDETWREDLTPGDFGLYFEVHGELTACQPNCIPPIGTSLSFSLTLHVPDDGAPSLVLQRLDWVSPATDVLADGTFVVSLQVVQTAADNGITAIGRVGPGRSITVEQFQHAIFYTNGFMAGWTSTATTTEPTTLSF